MEGRCLIDSHRGGCGLARARPQASSSLHLVYLSTPLMAEVSGGLQLQNESCAIARVIYGPLKDHSTAERLGLMK